MAPLDTITADEFSRWLPPADALEAIKPVMDFHTGCPAIVNLLRHGVIRAAGRRYYRRELGRDRDRGEFIVIPEIYWEAEWATNWKSQFWFSGQVEFQPYPTDRTGSRSIYGFIGIRFEPTLVGELCPTPAPAAPTLSRAQLEAVVIDTLARDGARKLAEQPPRHPGGRPALPFWEDAILAVAATIHLGDFKPESQADVARALADWISDHDHDAGDTAIKERARKIWNLFK
jgi:hypothetical protein